MNINADKLKAYLDAMDEEADAREECSGRLRDIVKRAKGDGFDTKALRKVHVRRRMDASVRQHDDDLLDIYEHALGAKGRALAAIEAGAPVCEAAATNGVHRATLARARNVAKQASIATPPHDPETGEIKPEGGDGRITDALNLSPHTDSASPSDCTSEVTQTCGVVGSRSEIVGSNPTGSQVSEPWASGNQAKAAVRRDTTASPAPALGQAGAPESDARPSFGEAGVAPGPQDSNDDGIDIPPFLRRVPAAA